MGSKAGEATPPANTLTDEQLQSLRDKIDTSVKVIAGLLAANGQAVLLDRLTHRCHIFEMNGESYRFRESVKAARKGKSN